MGYNSRNGYRIAMFTDSYKPQINGVVTSIESFAKQLRKKGHRVYIFAPEVPDYRDEDRDVFRVKSAAFSSYKEYRIGLPFRLLVDFPIEKLKPDIIHIHSPFSMGVTGLALARHYKIPAVGSFHTMFPDYVHYFVKYEKLYKSKMVKKIFRKSAWKYLRWFYNACGCVIAPTDKVRSILKKHGISKEIYVIPTGLEIKQPKKQRSKLREKYGFSKSDRLILHVGRITREKNIGFIINSLRELLKKNNYKLVVASDGPYRERLVEKAAGMDNVIFTGYLPPDKLQDFYRLSDVFVMASKTETQGIVLLEAAVNGLPVVALNSPVVGDVVRSAGIGVIAKQKDFAKTVEKVIGERKRQQGKRLEKYDIERCTGCMIDVYSSVIANSSSP